MEKLKKENLKEVNTQFRAWKSGKTWLYSSAIIAFILVGALGTELDVHADGQVLSSAGATGTENTATGGLGSNATAGADNASYANSLQSSITSSNMVVASSVAATSSVASSTTVTNTSNVVLRQDGTSVISNSLGSTAAPTGLPETKNTTNTDGTYSVNSSVNRVDSSASPALGVTNSTALNNNGAVQAGSSANSSTSFDIKQTQIVPSGEPANDILSGGNYSWTVEAPSDLVEAGLSVADTKVIYVANQESTANLQGTTTTLAVKNNATAQTIGGSYQTINEGAQSYYPNDVVGSEGFVQSTSTTAKNSAIASSIADLSKTTSSMAIDYASLSAAESQAIAAGGFNASAASLLTQMTNLLTSITANSTAIASMQNMMSAEETGYIVTSAASTAMVSIQYTADSSTTEALANTIGGAVGSVASLVNDIAAGAGSAWVSTTDTINQILNGNLASSLATYFTGALEAVIDPAVSVPDNVLKYVGLSATDYVNGIISSSVNTILSPFNQLSFNSILNGGQQQLNNLITTVLGTEISIPNPLTGGALFSGPTIGELLKINPTSFEQGIYNVATQIQSITTVAATALQQYGNNVQFAINSINESGKVLANASSPTSGIFTENYLAPVVDNGDGTFTVQGSGHGFITAVANWATNLVTNYTQSVGNELGTIVTLPSSITNLFDDYSSNTSYTGLAIVDNFLNGILNTTTAAYSNALKGYNSIVQGLQADITNSLTSGTNSIGYSLGQTLAGIGNIANLSNSAIAGSIQGNLSSPLDAIQFGIGVIDGVLSLGGNVGANGTGTAAIPTITASATMTVGFTAQDPSSQISQNLAYENYYYQGQKAVTGSNQDGMFVPETFVVKPTLNGATTTMGTAAASTQGGNTAGVSLNSAPTQAGYTTIVYQMNNENINPIIAPTSAVTITTQSQTVFVGDQYSPDAGFVSAIITGGKSLSLDELSVSGYVNTNSVGTYTVDYSYIDPITGKIYKSSAPVYVASGNHQLAGAYLQGQIYADGNQLAYDFVQVENDMMDANTSQPTEGTLYDTHTGKIIATAHGNMVVDNIGAGHVILTYSFDASSIPVGDILTSTVTFADPITLPGSGSLTVVAPNNSNSSSSTSNSSNVASSSNNSTESSSATNNSSMASSSSSSISSSAAPGGVTLPGEGSLTVVPPTGTTDPGVTGPTGPEGKEPDISIGENGDWYIDGKDTGFSAQGPAGVAGKDGADGQNGTNGKDGESPTLTIGNNGDIFINGKDTGVSAQGPAGVAGKDGADGQNGTNGKDGESPTLTIGNNGDIFINGKDTGVSAQGPAGVAGKDGANGQNGKDGVNTDDTLGNNMSVKVIEKVPFSKVGNTALSVPTISTGNNSALRNKVNVLSTPIVSEPFGASLPTTGSDELMSSELMALGLGLLSVLTIGGIAWRKNNLKDN
ncbi:bacterial Ig-like domain-containing protein [Lactococcus lactis]|uniref:beta strand repeat-containing protein n=1 Tax=Lactococcus lactis TaxID=1358 RepID=UPI003D1665E6